MGNTYSVGFFESIKKIDPDLFSDVRRIVEGKDWGYVSEQSGYVPPNKRYRRKANLMAKKYGAGISFETTKFKDVFYHHPETKRRLLDYNRQHPFYPDWADWKDVVHRYYHDDTILATYFTCEYLGSYTHTIHDAKYTDIQLGMILQLAQTVASRCSFLLRDVQPGDVNGYIEALDKTDYDSVYIPFQDFETLSEGIDGNKSDAFKIKYLGQFLAISQILDMQVFDKVVIDPDRLYTIDMIRTILSLNFSKQRRLPIECFFDREKFYDRRTTLLERLYKLSYMDNASTMQMVQMIEQLKHFRIAKEQGSVPLQCQRDWELFPEEFWTLCKKVVKSNRVTEQGFFSPVQHEVRVHEDDWHRLQQMLEVQRHEFITRMGGMFMSTAMKVTSLFLTATVLAALLRFSVETAIQSVVRILNMLYRLITGENDDTLDAKEQGGEITIPFLPAFFVKYVISPPATFLQRFWQTSTFDATMRRIGFFGDLKIEHGIERITTWIKGVMYKVHAWYMYQIHGILVPDDLNDDNHAIVNWNNEVDAVLKEYYADKLFWNETTWSLVYSLYAKGTTLARTPAYAKQKHDVWKIVGVLSNILEKFKQHNKDGSAIRNPPVTIYLTGQTGAGKSSLTYPLAAEILKGIFENEPCPINLQQQWRSMVYMRSSEQEFWDGYENQLITVFDDFSQRADATSNPNLELFEIIRSSNCFPYPLHMAAIDQKANTQFTSKVIIVSSNQERPLTHSLNFPEALYRRFDVCVRVTRIVKEETKRFDPEQYRFALYDMTTGKTLRTIDYNDLVALCTSQYTSRKDYTRSVEDYINERLAGPSREQGLLPGDHGVDPDIFMDAFGPRECVEPSTSVLMNQLRMSVEDLRLGYNVMQSHWMQFKAEHPYLVSAMQALSTLAMAIGFVCMFKTVWNSFKKSAPNKGRKDPKRELHPDPFSTTIYPSLPTMAEAYAPIPPRAKAEAYSPGPPRAVAEAYHASAPPMARPESLPLSLIHI